MERLANWQSNLTNLIVKRREEPYSIVNFNCLLWACEAIKAVTGENHYLPFVGKFKNEAGAAKTLRKIGKAKTCAAFIEQRHNIRLHLSSVKKGDIVVASPITEGFLAMSGVALFGPAIGVCYGQQTFFVGQDKLVVFETLALGSGSYGLHC